MNNKNQANINNFMQAEQEYNDTTKRDVFSWMINKGVAIEIVTRLHELWDFSLKMGDKLYHIGKIIVIKLVEFVKRNPNMSTGIAIGLGLSWLISQVPVLGWLLGPLVTLILTVHFMYKGHLKDHPDSNIFTACGECFKVVVDIISEIKGELTQ